MNIERIPALEKLEERVKALETYNHDTREQLFRLTTTLDGKLRRAEDARDQWRADFLRNEEHEQKIREAWERERDAHIRTLDALEKTQKELAEYKGSNEAFVEANAGLLDYAQWATIAANALITNESRTRLEAVITATEKAKERLPSEIRANLPEIEATDDIRRDERKENKTILELTPEKRGSLIEKVTLIISERRGQVIERDFENDRLRARAVTW